MNNTTFGNEYKTGGIYKQKYFCQLCNRQCQDKDGFKCHISSNTHRINMEIVSQSPEEYINRYSKEFENGFIDILKRNYLNNFVNANIVYGEYILDKESTHLNATKWPSLSSFLKYLESTSKCLIRSDEKETKIKYVEKSHKSVNDKYKEDKRIKEELLEEKKKQIEANKIKLISESVHTNIDVLKDKNTSIVNPELLKNISFEFKNNVTKEMVKNSFINDKKDNMLQKKRLLSPQKEDKSKEKIDINIDENQLDLINVPWIKQDLIVKIKDKDLEKGKLFDKKGRIVHICNDFVAEIKMILTFSELKELGHSSYHKVKVDQALLEPIIPAIGSNVIILYAKYKWQTGLLTEINIKDNFAYVKINEDIIQVSLNGICKKLV